MLILFLVVLVLIPLGYMALPADRLWPPPQPPPQPLPPQQLACINVSATGAHCAVLVDGVGMLVMARADLSLFNVTGAPVAASVCWTAACTSIEVDVAVCAAGRAAYVDNATVPTVCAPPPLPSPAPPITPPLEPLGVTFFVILLLAVVIVFGCIIGYLAFELWHLRKFGGRSIDEYERGEG